MTNNDYILRSDALFELYRYASAKDPALMIAHRVDLCERIEKIPAADVVPAPVRCSDCRFYDKRDGGAPGGTGWCSRPGAGCGVPEEFFCAGAELKKTNNQIEMG